MHRATRATTAQYNAIETCVQYTTHGKHWNVIVVMNAQCGVECRYTDLCLYDSSYPATSSRIHTTAHVNTQYFYNSRVHYTYICSRYSYRKHKLLVSRVNTCFILFVSHAITLFLLFIKNEWTPARYLRSIILSLIVRISLKLTNQI